MSNLTLRNGGNIELTDNNALAISNVEYIKSALEDITYNFFRLGYYLWEATEYGYHMRLGYSDLYEYALTEFDLAKTTVKNLLNVIELTAIQSDDSNSYHKRYNKQIKPKYKEYTFSQLVELYRLECVKHYSITSARITPTDSVRTIREKVDKLTKSQTSDFLPNQTVMALPQAEVITIQPEEITAEDITVETSNITVFKNDDERKDFLNEYKSWSLWLEIKPLKLTVYRVQLTDGSTILACRYVCRGNEYWKEHASCKYLFFKPEEEICLDFYDTAMTYVVEHMRNNKLGAYWVKQINKTTNA